MALIFPKLRGRGWNIVKQPTWQTRIQRAVSGRELRIADYPQILWLFTLEHNFLLGPAVESPPGAPIGSPGNGRTDAATFQGFWLQAGGPLGAFFYDDPTDDSVVGQVIGIGDGTTTKFQLVRFFGYGPAGFIEAITAPRNVSNVYLNGIAQPVAGWSIDSTTGLLSFLTAPPLHAVITADFTYWFRCRFSEDTLEIEEMMYLIHACKRLSFLSALGDTTPAPGP
jgi:hypothetical protein